MKRTNYSFTVVATCALILSSSCASTTKECFPREADPARIIYDGEYLVSYFSGPSMSYLKAKEDSEWTTDGGPLDFTEAGAVLEKVPNNFGRLSPSMLDEKTMYYSISNG